MRTRFLGTIVLSILLFAANAFAITGIKDTPVLTSLDGFSSFDQQPVINSNGDVAFTAIGSSGQDGVYVYSAQDQSITRLDFGQAKIRRPINMNNDRTVAVAGSDSTGEGIFVQSPGGTLITIHGNNFSQYTDPSILDDGSILFTALDATSKEGGYRASSSGQIITIFGASDLSFNPSGDLAVNNSGSFAVAGIDPNDGSLGIYAGSGGGSIITISGANFSSVSALSVSHSGSKLAWSGTLSVSGSSTSALYIANLSGGSVITISGANFGQCAVDSNGDVLADVTDPTSGERSLKEYFETGDIPTSELSIGDSLDGSTITDFSIGPNSLSDNGEFVFYAQLADGSSGVFASFVPEPIFTAPLIGGMLLLRRRRCWR